MTEDKVEVTTIERLDSTELLRLFTAIGNFQTGLGTPRDSVQYGRVNLSFSPLTQAELDILPRKSAILKRVIELYPNDAARSWCNLSLGESDLDPNLIFNYLRDLRDKPGRISARKAFQEASALGRQYGDGYILLGVIDGRGPSEPIDLERIESVRWLKVCDRYEIYPGVSGDRRNPEYYHLNFRYNEHLPEDDSRIWHRDRVLRFPGYKLRGNSLAYNSGCNDSVIQAMFDSFSNYMQGIAASSNMLVTYDQVTMGIKNLSARMVSDNLSNSTEQRNKILERALALDMGRSVARILFHDLDNEEVGSVNRRYQGADKIIETLERAWAADSDIPRFHLFNELGSTGISSVQMAQNYRFHWASLVASWQENNWRENLEWLLKLVMLASDSPTKGEVPQGWSIEFPSEIKLSPLEEVELQEMVAKRDATNIASGVYTPFEARQQYRSAFTHHITLDADTVVPGDPRESKDEVL